MIFLGSLAIAPLADAENAFTPSPVLGQASGARSRATGSLEKSSSEAAAIRAWKRSLVPVVVSQSLDIASSYGMRELNPLLAGPDGRFGAKATTIKIGAAAAVVGLEYLIVRKWPNTGRVFSKLNWGSAVLTGSFAAHNYRIR